MSPSPLDVAEALVRLRRFTTSSMASNPKEAQWMSVNDLRFADSVLGLSEPGAYGDERDPWPDKTAAEIVRLFGPEPQP